MTNNYEYTNYFILAMSEDQSSNFHCCLIKADNFHSLFEEVMCEVSDWKNDLYKHSPNPSSPTTIKVVLSKPLDEERIMDSFFVVY